MLKSHACININFVKILDDIITIARVLTNFTGFLNLKKRKKVVGFVL